MRRTIIQSAVAMVICLACSSVTAQDNSQVRDAAEEAAVGNVEFTAHPEAKFEKKTPAEIDAYERAVAAKLKTLSQREICDLALVPPILNTNPLPEFDYDQLDYGMTIGMTQTPKGRIWSCWVAGEDGPGGFFVLNRSETDGERFSKPMLVINMHKKGLPARSTLVGNLWTDPAGTVWLFFNQTIGHVDGRDGVWVTTCKDPDAAQPQWSKPRRICHGFVLSKPTILANGEWMLPVEFIDSSSFPELKKYRGANLLVSKDQGGTWSWRSVASFPNSNWVEPMIVELKDGRLWLLARTRTVVMQRYSSDGGRTWTKPSLPTFKHPRARFFIRRLSSGRILLIKHGKTIDEFPGSGPDYKGNNRSHLTAWLSEDEGKTWRGGLMLDERATVSYPDGFQTPDGTIHISWDRNRATDGEILMARFTEDDVLTRAFKGPKSKTKMLISRPLAHEQPAFVSLFDGKTFAGWKHGGNWVIEDGAFFRKKAGGSLTYTKALVPDDFELRFEWKVSKGCNSGVYYRPAQYEYQILDNVHSPYGENPRQAAGSLFFCMAPSKDATKPFGQWNSGRVKCKGTVIEHWVNGKRVLSFDYTSPKWEKQVELLKIRGADLNARGGRLWLQDHGQDVWFRKLRWREIPGEEELRADPDFVPLPVTGEALKKEQDRVKRMLEAQKNKQSQ